MSDHYHYGYAYDNHDHGGYASEHHDHSLDYAERYHRHSDLEREDERLQGGLREVMAQVDVLRREFDEQLTQAFGRIRELEEGLQDALNCIHSLEDRQPDYADDEPEPEHSEYDPGPEVDDEGGMSEYRYAITPEEPW